MTKSELKDELVKIIGCSVISLDLIDIYDFLPREFNHSIQYCYQILDELVKGELVKKDNQGASEYYSIVLE